MSSSKKRRPKADTEDERVICKVCDHAFKVIGWKHLVFKHGYDPEHPVRDYLEQYGVSRVFSGMSQRKLALSRNKTLVQQGKRWTKKRVKREILSLHRRGMPLSFKAQRKRGGSLGFMARQFFGSWYGALAASGLDPVEERIRQRWSAKKIIDVIQKEYRAGRDVRESALNGRFSALPNAARRVFGSWSKALSAAKLDPVKINGRHSWDLRTVLDEIRKLGRRVPASVAMRNHRPLAKAAYRYAGGWAKACREAGVR